MSLEVMGVGAPDELRCRYGVSKLMFRGPRRNLNDPYVAFLGGNETFGKHVQTPFAALLDDETDKNCINLGVSGAGLDAFANDPEVLNLAKNADQVVLQVLGAQSLSNRFYRVHPRRNDRFLEASPLLSAIYRDVDFTDFNFVKHMLGTLHDLSPKRFETVRDEIQQAWLSRMKLLVQTISNDVVLLWLRYHKGGDLLGSEPLAITDAMIEQLRPSVSNVVEIPVVPSGITGEIDDMMIGQMQAPAAAHLIGPSTHRQIAETLKGRIRT
ncbi:MAG: hypothetical protein KUG70_01170 [Rhodobacteraceae bacterium]|nr:hypothetical protein [Paracoccaceae bacterium]